MAAKVGAGPRKPRNRPHKNKLHRFPITEDQKQLLNLYYAKFEQLDVLSSQEELQSRRAEFWKQSRRQTSVDAETIVTPRRSSADPSTASPQQSPVFHRTPSSDFEQRTPEKQFQASPEPPTTAGPSAVSPYPGELSAASAAQGPLDSPITGPPADPQFPFGFPGSHVLQDSVMAQSVPAMPFQGAARCGLASFSPAHMGSTIGIPPINDLGRVPAEWQVPRPPLWHGSPATTGAPAFGWAASLMQPHHDPRNQMPQSPPHPQSFMPPVFSGQSQQQLQHQQQHQFQLMQHLLHQQQNNHHNPQQHCEYQNFLGPQQHHVPHSLSTPEPTRGYDNRYLTESAPPPRLSATSPERNERQRRGHRSKSNDRGSLCFGVVKRYDDQRSIGVISTADYEDLEFVRSSANFDPQEGDQVVFHRQQSSGAPKARQVRRQNDTMEPAARLPRRPLPFAPGTAPSLELVTANPEYEVYRRPSLRGLPVFGEGDKTCDIRHFFAIADQIPEAAHDLQAPVGFVHGLPDGVSGPWIVAKTLRSHANMLLAFQQSLTVVVAIGLVPGRATEQRKPGYFQRVIGDFVAWDKKIYSVIMFAYAGSPMQVLEKAPKNIVEGGCSGLVKCFLHVYAVFFDDPQTGRPTEVVIPFEAGLGRELREMRRPNPDVDLDGGALSPLWKRGHLHDSCTEWLQEAATLVSAQPVDTWATDAERALVARAAEQLGARTSEDPCAGVSQQVATELERAFGWAWKRVVMTAANRGWRCGEIRQLQDIEHARGDLLKWRRVVTGGQPTARWKVLHGRLDQSGPTEEADEQNGAA